MLIDVKKISREGLVLHNNVEVDENLLIEESGYFLKDLEYTVHFSLDGDRRIRAKGEIKTAISLNCVRCTEPFEQPIQSKFDIILFPIGLIQGTSAVLNDQDTEYIFYEGDQIDLVKILMEQVNLFIPFKPVCNEDCRGICPVCGVNLNHVKCRCDRSFSDTGSVFDKIKR